MRQLPLLLATLALLTGPALAAHTTQGPCSGSPALGLMEIGWGDPNHTYYVDDRNAVTGAGIWLYQESNGVYTPGDAPHSLQRGGPAPAGSPLGPDPCTDVGPWNPDLRLF